jgi:phosphatidate cytidylyltransferase
MLKKRVLTAAVILPPIVGIIFYGKGLPFLLLVEGAALLCSREYFRMFFPEPREWWVGIALTGLVYAAGAMLPSSLVAAAILVLLALGAFHFFRVGGTMEERVRGAALTVLGAVYIGGFFSTFPRTIALPQGPHWVMIGMLAVAAGDTFAYFAGRAFGKRPLSPFISPNKTVEGAVAGIAGSILCGGVYAGFFLAGIPAWYAVTSCAVLGAAGQGGDLFESMLKRAAGVKDSGSLLPGHGGLFDRADGIIAAGPPLHLLVLFSPLAGGL